MKPGELRERRLVLRLSQAELSRVLGVTRNSLARWERGDLPIRHPELVALALDKLANQAGAPADAKAMGNAVAHHNLPAELTSFVGRQPELFELGRLLETARLVTLVGTGGIGKTRVALRLARDVLGVFPDGTWLVELAALSDGAQVARAVAAALQIREGPGWPIRAAIADAIGERALLIVLDNCEHVVDACAELANSLLCACPALRILATSREPLGTAGEMTWIVGGLCTPSERGQPVENVNDFESVQLFVERAKAVDPAFEATVQNLRAAGQICHRLDGIPLAIELAAARLPALTLDEILARLDRRLDLLTLGPRTAPPRQQTLRAMVSWSYELLSEMDRRLLRQLSVFAGGWTQEAAAAVCDLAVFGSDGEDCVSDGLARLVARSLVAHTHAPTGESRFSLLETIRAFAREQLALSEEEHIVCQRHAAYFLTVSEK